MSDDPTASRPGNAQPRLEDLSSEDFNRLFGKVFGKIKQAAGLSLTSSDEDLYKALTSANHLQEEKKRLEEALSQEQGRGAGSSGAARRLFELALTRLPEPVRAKAPAIEGTDPAELVRWTEIALSLSGQGAPAPKNVDSVRSGAVPPSSDAETWLSLMADSASARAFKKAHPEEWRRLVERFGGKSFSEVQSLTTRKRSF